MKKEWKAIIAVVLSVWLFVMGFELGSYKEKKNFQKNKQTYVAAPVTSQTLPTEAPSTEAVESTLFSFDDVTSDTQAQSDDLQSLLTTMAVPETSAAQPTAAPATTAAPTVPTTPVTAAPTTQSAPKTDPAKLSKEDVLKEVNAAMRTLRSEKNMLAHKTESTKIVLTECSAKAAVGLINKALENAGVNETVTYAFRDGKAVGTDEKGKAADNGKTVTPRDVIPPAETDFDLSSKGVQSATAQRSGSDIVYTIKLVPEKTTLQSPVPPYNSKAIGYVDFSKRELTGVTLEQVNITYPGSVITVTVGSDGRVIKLTDYLPLQGDGAAKVTVFSGTAKFSGDVSATWTFRY